MLDLSKLKHNDNYKVYFTYNDIKHMPEYPEGPLVEILDGELFMPPSPTTRHQKISLNLVLLIGNYLKNRNIASLFTSPIDVIFSDKNVFIPDLVLIKLENKHIITEKNIVGAPDFIIEILLKNKANDLIFKKQFYQKFGVKEYWIIDPFEEIVLKYILDGKEYILERKYKNSKESIKIETIDFEFPINKIFK